MSLRSQTARAPSLSRLEALAPALTALLLGLFLVYGAGFAHTDLLHAAAHDGRHAFAFPCH